MKIGKICIGWHRLEVLIILALLALPLTMTKPPVVYAQELNGNRPVKYHTYCFRAGDLGLAGVAPVGESGYLVAWVYNGSSWLATTVSVGANQVEAVPIIDPRATLRVPVMPARLKEDTPVCVSAPLIAPVNITMLKGGVPAAGVLVEAGFDGSRSYFVLGSGLKGPQPLLMVRRPSSLGRPIRTYMTAGPTAIWEPPTPGTETMIVSFKSRYFNQTSYDSQYCAQTFKKIDFPNGTDEIEFYLTNKTTLNSWYLVGIDVYDASGQTILYTSERYVYLDGSQVIYLGASVDLYAAGLSGQPVKVVFRVCGVAGRTVDAVIYARVRVSRYINGYASIGARDVTVGIYTTGRRNPQLIKNESYILVPSVLPALGHIDGSGLFFLSLTYRCWYEWSLPDSLTIYAYYGGRLIGTSTAQKSGYYPYYEYHFESWSWYCPDCAIESSLRTMGANSDILIGPFPTIGVGGTGERDVVLEYVKLAGRFRPEMNRPRSWLYKNMATSWLVAHISDHSVYPSVGESSILSVRVDVSEATRYPRIAVTLQPYMYFQQSFSLFDHYKLTFSFTRTVVSAGASYWVEDSSVKRVVETLNPLITVLNIIAKLPKIPSKVGWVSFFANTALNNAAGSVEVSLDNSAKQLSVDIYVGWAERYLPQGVYVDVTVSGFASTDYSITLLSVEVSGKPIYVGATANLDGSISSIPSNTTVDRYRTLYCGYQEDPDPDNAFSCKNTGSVSR